MTLPEIRLKCLELAMEQAKREGSHADRNSVAIIEIEFYNRITGLTDLPESEKSVKTKSKADKSPEIFK